MKTKLLSLIAIGTFALGSLSSCTKYEDGPLLSLRTKKARLTGEWEVVETKVNDETQSDSDSDVFYTFEKDLDFEYREAGDNISVTAKGEWDFSSGKEKIRITFSNGDVEEYTILRLTNKELWIEYPEENLSGSTVIVEEQLEKK